MARKAKQQIEKSREILSARRAQDPLAYLLGRYQRMKGSPEKDAIAMQLLPYFHAKLRSVEVKAEKPIPVTVVEIGGDE